MVRSAGAGNLPAVGLPEDTERAPQLRHQDVQGGLSSNTVYAIEEDQYGFIWFGTENGLNRYDSREWVYYYFNPTDTAGISNSKIQAILSDHEGRLWIGTAKGLNRFSFEDNTFLKITSDNKDTALGDKYIRCLYQDSDHDIWVGTSEGLFIIPDSDSVPMVHRLQVGGGTDSENNIITLFEDAQGVIWFGTGSGLYYTRNKKDIFRFEIMIPGQGTLRNAQIRAILEINQLLLVATENNGLFAYFSGKDSWGELALLTNGIRREFIYRDLYMDGDSTLWIASTEGLLRLPVGSYGISPGERTEWHAQQILTHSVRTIFEDRHKGLWIGTQYNGMYSHYDDNFLFHQVGVPPEQRGGLTNSVVSSFLVEEDSVWIGTDGGGLNLWLRDEDTFSAWTEKDGLINNNIKCIARDRSGRLWIGTFKGLSILYEGRFRNYDLSSVSLQSAKTLSNHLLSLYLDPATGLAWFGTDGLGLVKFDPVKETFTPVSMLSSDLKASTVNDLLSVSDTMLILGTSSGLYYYDMLQDHFHLLPITLYGLGDIKPYVICMEPQDDRYLWIGTEKYGIIYYDLFTMTAFPVRAFEGIAGIVINAIHHTGPGELWCSTNQGLNHIHFSFEKDSLQVLESQMYTESYGVQSRQFMPRASYFSSQEELFFGGISGFNYFFPDQISDEVLPLPTYIKTLNFWDSRNDRMVEQRRVFPSGEHLTFTHYIRNITIEFIGINFSHPENTRYSYRFSGEGENWIDLGTRNFIAFNHLSNGDYHIEIRSSEDPDYWPGASTHMDITILPPIWKSGVAIVLYILLILLLLYLFYRTITRWERLRSELQVEQLQREQEQQLHEHRIRFFTDISHELRTPLTLILSPIDMILSHQNLSMRVRNTLQMVKQHGEKMLQLVNQLLDLRKAETGHLKFRAARGNMVHFLQEVMLSFRDLALNRKIHMEFISRKEAIEVYYDRDKLEVVITNLLSNALKHTHERGTVTMSVEEHPDPGDVSLSSFPDGFVQVIIEDTGEGIPADRLEKIFDRFYEENAGLKGMGIGLELSKKYIDLHRGTIAVESEVEEEEKPGFSRFTIRLPLGRRHLSDDQILKNYTGSEDIKNYTEMAPHPSLHADLEAEISKLTPGETKRAAQYQLLVIEDNDELREFLIQMLGNHYRVRGAENGAMGWEHLLRSTFDLIISDIMMPGMDGIELCRRVKTDVRTSHIPVILLTARTAITFKYEGLETGADEYITKPFHVEYLSLKIKNLLYQREMIKRKYLKDSITDPELITLTSMDEKLLKKVIEYIHSHMDQGDLTVESISEHLGISRVHLYRKIKSFTGVTPQEFLKTVRLKYAASLLSQKKLRISEVAFMCGYKDLAYFSKSFKAFYGISPTQYIQNS